MVQPTVPFYVVDADHDKYEAEKKLIEAEPAVGWDGSVRVKIKTADVENASAVF